MKWPFKTVEEVAAITKPEPAPVPVAPVLSPAFPVADYLRIPPVNTKPVHVPKPVEVFPNCTGVYTVNGISTHRKDN
ncbi:MAG: hypothetical protein HOP22_06055 [Nitrospiraceae bacterium]|nr:hypothetical protein [Nitrospiraceae bacterium]